MFCATSEGKCALPRGCWLDGSSLKCQTGACLQGATSSSDLHWHPLSICRSNKRIWAKSCSKGHSLFKYFDDMHTNRVSQGTNVKTNTNHPFGNRESHLENVIYPIRLWQARAPTPALGGGGGSLRPSFVCSKWLDHVYIPHGSAIPAAYLTKYNC